jgi:hypothetical protein
MPYVHLSQLFFFLLFYFLYRLTGPVAPQTHTYEICLYIFSYTESDRTHKAISLGLCLVCI